MNYNDVINLWSAENRSIPTQIPISPASESQVGGDHYRKYTIQPIEYITANGLGFLAGNVVKYVTRYKEKGGVEDIKKAIHYLELILEFEYRGGVA